MQYQAVNSVPHPQTDKPLTRQQRPIHVRFKQLTTAVAFVLAFWLMGSGLAHAGLAYYVAGKEYQSSGTTTRWTGGHAYAKVAVDEFSGISYSHVNSIYMRRDAQNSYEVGFYFNGSNFPQTPRGGW